ncbi:hypothetical protein [Actinacidiphila yeochonensis]|uniref:hypothetical protein n=1 Tax=Actinacidiphila yeochonensis TaxID=89050 RepID=UPI000560EA6C|nr:hypothetical protein [Actinacidiphila yeochonensis]
MTTPPSAFPDVEALVIQILQAEPSLSSAAVSRDAPAGFDGTQSAVLVSRYGGAWVGDLYLDNPMMQLEVYGPDKATSFTLANAARHALLSTIGTSYGGVTVSDVVEQDGPRWMPDYLYNAAKRYVCIIRMSIDSR